MLEVTIITPESKQNSFTTNSLMVPLEDGYWGILPGHANMVASLGKGKISAKENNGDIVFVINKGWIEVFHDKIIIITPEFEKVTENR
ncbi:MAG: F0F1 ATP synthase subunit epsilon [Caldisericia bacterium]|nr:F0F1 ATP synthase subunit epsilon [Caldisericia bacterium]